MRKVLLKGQTLANLPGEKWTEVDGFPLYDISNMGRLRMKPREIHYKWRGKEITRKYDLKLVSIIRVTKRYGHKGRGSIRYSYAKLRYGEILFQKSIPYLVAHAFIPNPHFHWRILHKDGDRWNNKASNLMWRR